MSRAGRVAAARTADGKVAVDGVVNLSVFQTLLLQPERINAYAEAVIRTLQADEHQRGCLTEERVLKGDLAYGGARRSRRFNSRMLQAVEFAQRSVASLAALNPGAAKRSCRRPQTRVRVTSWQN